MINHNLDQERITKLQRLLLEWFEKNHRVFPWRETKNPFYILIAEKLLQQTLVGDRVIKAYLQITSLYPTSVLLSQTNVEALKDVLKPLGLPYRAKELVQLATALQTQFAGEVPQDYKLLLTLPGVGEYAARAVLSFAYCKNIGVVDTNVARFLYRYFGIDQPFPANPARKKYLLRMMDFLIPKEKSREFNFAILDLCAILCKVKKPNCSFCPVNLNCNYYLAFYKK